MKVELENILDIGTTLYSLDENFKIKGRVVVNIQSVFKQDVSHSPEIHTTYKVSNTMSNCYATDVKDSEIGESWFTSKSEKQLKWQKRSRILWRLKGMVGFPFEEGVLTSLEHERLNVAFSIIRGVVQDSVESSIELGFNAERRCTFGVCRKPAIEGSEYCREHKEYMEERQCQR